MSEKAYNEKLDMSFGVCIAELTCPEPNWEERISDIKFTINPSTMKALDFCEFEFNLEGDKDDIKILGGGHTYIFKRSLFYKKFKKSNNNRIKLALKEFYNSRGFEVDLYPARERLWILRLSWVNTEFKNPNIVVRTPRSIFRR